MSCGSAGWSSVARAMFVVALGYLVLMLLLGMVSYKHGHTDRAVGQGHRGCSGAASARLATATTPAAEEAPAVVLELHSAEDVQAHLDEPTDNVCMFHAPWCGHCVKTLPHFQAAALAMQGKVNCFSADCHNSPMDAALKRYKLTGFPAFVRVTATGDVRVFQGARDVAALLAFMEA
jgi:thiol-disulfide isomerase/thioredoxin